MGPSGFEPESSGPEPPRIDQATPRTRATRGRCGVCISVARDVGFRRPCISVARDVGFRRPNIRGFVRPVEVFARVSHKSRPLCASRAIPPADTQRRAFITGPSNRSGDGTAPGGAAGSEKEEIQQARIRCLAGLWDLEGYRDSDGLGLGPVRRPKRRRRRPTSLVLAPLVVAITEEDPEGASSRF